MASDIRQMIHTFLFSALIASMFAYVFEIFIPYTEAEDRLRVECTDLGGMVYKEVNKPTICIKKEIIKIK